MLISQFLIVIVPPLFCRTRVAKRGRQKNDGTAGVLRQSTPIAIARISGESESIVDKSPLGLKGNRDIVRHSHPDARRNSVDVRQRAWIPRPVPGRFLVINVAEGHLVSSPVLVGSIAR